MDLASISVGPLGLASSLLGAISATIGSRSLIAKYWDHKRATRSASDNIALSLVQALKERIDSLERASDAERDKCASEIAALREARDHDRELHAAHLEIVQHELRGLEQMVDTLLYFRELAPERLSEAMDRMAAAREEKRRRKLNQQAGGQDGTAPPAE